MLGKTKGTIEQLEPVVAWDPPPCYVSHFSKLREGYTAAKVGASSVIAGRSREHNPSFTAQQTAPVRAVSSLCVACWPLPACLLPSQRRGHSGHGVQAFTVP